MVTHITESAVSRSLGCLTLCRFGACADAVFRAVDLFSLHHNVLETFVVSVKTVLQELTESHRAAGKDKIKDKIGLIYVAVVENRKKFF